MRLVRRSLPVFPLGLVLSLVIFCAPAKAVLTDEDLGARADTHSPAPASAPTPAATTNSAQHENAPPPRPHFQSIVPTVSVDVPGLRFGRSHIEGNDVIVPFLSDYIVAWYRFLIPVAFIAATVAIIYGGFLYLIGSAGGDSKKGLEIIKNAVIGTVLVLGAFLILHTVNPATLELNAVRLPYIQGVQLINGEFENSESTLTSAGPDLCTSGAGNGGTPLSAGQNVIRLGRANYNQCDSRWGGKAYAGIPEYGFQPGQTGYYPAGTLCPTASSRNCLSTFCQSACGPTALATVLGYYGVQAGGHVITPMETAMYAIRDGSRDYWGGTHGSWFDAAHIAQAFPGFSAQSVNADQVATEIRAGHPLIFNNFGSGPCVRPSGGTLESCTGCTFQNREGHPICGGGAGHYLVAIGVSDDGNTIFVHDPGHAPGGVFSAPLSLVHGLTFHKIFPTNGQGGATVSHTSATNPSSGNLCHGSGAAAANNASSQSRVSGNIKWFTYNYQPTANNWMSNESWAAFPNRLDGQSAHVHVFVFIHGYNSGGTAPGGGPAGAIYAHLLRSALKEVAGDTTHGNIVVLAPHNRGGEHNSPYMQRFNLQSFFTAAWAAVQANGGQHFSIDDVVVGGHSAATCNAPIPIIQANNANLGGRLVRGVIAYDGCMGYGLDSGALSNDSQTTFLNFDGMSRDRNGFSNSIHSWGLTQTITCPGYIAESGHYTEACFRNPTRQWYGFQSHFGHRESMYCMTRDMFQAFYGTNDGLSHCMNGYSQALSGG